jgi:hypothetical protein
MKHRVVRTLLVCNVCSSLRAGERCPARCTRNFVLGGWSSSLKHSTEAGMITASDWIDVMHPQIAKICARPETRVMVAIGEVADDAYLGFIAGEPTENVVHYVFVKELYRQRGIASSLFKALGVDPKSRFAYPANTRVVTDPAGAYLKRKIPLAVRDPAVARYPKSERHRSYS